MPWQQTALLATLIANANRDAEAKPEPFRITDFLPAEPEVQVLNDLDDELPEEEPHWMKMKRLLQTLADAQKENRT